MDEFDALIGMASDRLGAAEMVEMFYCYKL
jgi:hypothetical protein